MSKLILTSFTATLVSAGLQQMNEQLAELMENVTMTDRNLIPLLGPTFNQINQYGCWCYFDPSDFHMGKGVPINGVDSLCRTLHEGYKCAMMDSKEETKIHDAAKCVPYEVTYVPGTSRGLSQLNSKCQERNSEDKCAERACIIEGYFVLNVFQAFFDPSQNHNLHFLHSNGFDREEECMNQKVQGERRDPFCCGSYPIRRPYNNQDGNKKCCGSLSYNSDLHQCCDDATEQISLVC